MQKSVGVAVTILFGLFALPALIFGFYLIACSIRIHTTEVYYVEYPYLAAGSALVALGAGIFCCASYGVSRGVLQTPSPCWSCAWVGDDGVHPRWDTACAPEHDSRL